MDLREWFGEAQETFVPAFPNKEPEFTLMNEDDRLVLKGTVSGFKPEDLEFTVKPDSITIQGSSEEEQSLDRDDLWQQVRSKSAFLRTISLPEKIDPQQVEVNMEGEKLTISMPKQQSPQSRTIKIKPQNQGKFLQ